MKDKGYLEVSNLKIFSMKSNKRKEFLGKYLPSIITSTILAGSSLLLFLKVEYSFYIYLFVMGMVLGYYVLKRSKFFSLWVLIVTSVFWSTGLLIFTSGVVAMLSVPIGGWSLYVPLLFIIPLLIFSPISFMDFKIKPAREGIILLVLALISLISRVYSVRGFIAPILHDPIAHAVWAKQIYDTGLINYFYSPGLHILSASGMMADGVTVSKYVLILTNIFNALTFVPVYLFVRSYFKDKKFAIVSAALFIIAIFPAKFFWAAGKNGLVMAIPFIFLSLFIASQSLESVKKFVLLNLLLFSLILIHYPAAFIGLLGVFFILICRGLFKELKNLLGAVFLGILWGLIKLPYQVKHLSEAVSSSSISHLDLQNISILGKGLYSQVVHFLDFPGGEYVLILGFLGLSLMFLISFKKKRYLCFMLYLLANILFYYVIHFTKSLSFLKIVASTQELTFFVFIYIGAAFLIAKVVLPFLLKFDKRFLHAFYITLLVLSLYSSCEIYTTYRSKQTALNLVEEDDLEVFRWMNTEIGEENTVLNNAAKNNRASFVFASDGGAWLPVFTNLDITMPFSEASYIRTHENYEIYQKILNREYSCEDIEYFVERGVLYYYEGSKGVFGGQIDPGSGEENFELVFSSGSARLFKLNLCGGE